MTGDEAADLVVDCFGMMHAGDQAGAVARRGARVRERGVLFLQYHSLETIVRRGQWNALRHGHYAYYSTTALASMLARAGFAPLHAWEFDLYGGTVLLAAVRTGDGRRADDSVDALLAREQNAGVCDPAIVGRLQDAMQSHAEHVRDWLVAANASGRRVVGYGAASRAVALLVHAGVDASLLPAVVDASPAKDGRRMPGTDIPVVDPSHLAPRTGRCPRVRARTGARGAGRLSRGRSRRRPVGRRRDAGLTARRNEASDSRISRRLPALSLLAPGTGPGLRGSG